MKSKVAVCCLAASIAAMSFVSNANAAEGIVAGTLDSDDTRPRNAVLSVDTDKFMVVGEAPGDIDEGIGAISSALEDAGAEGFSAEEINAETAVIDVAGFASAYDEAAALAEDLDGVEVVPVRRYKLLAGMVRSDYDPKTYFDSCPSFQGEAFGNVSEYGDEHYGGASTVKPYQMAEKTGRTATVAVIDSGCRISHYMLRGKIREDLAYNSVTGEHGAKAVEDKIDHGTGVASVIAANPHVAVDEDRDEFRTGVAANTKIVPIKAIDDETGEFDDVALLKALVYVEELVSTGKVSDLHVVNMSLGGFVDKADLAWNGYGDKDADPLYAQIRKLHDEYGIICVGAAGNEGDNGSMAIGDEFVGGDNYMFPADYDCAVSVMSMDTVGTLSWFSNTGPEKDIAAPGWSVPVAGSADDAAYSSADGTSFAAPIVSGAIVTLMQLDPKLSVDDAEDLLEKTAQPIACFPGAGNNAEHAPAGCLGAGAINLEKAVWLDYRNRGKATSYWTGMSDAASIGGVLYGFKVLSAKDKTVAATSTGPIARVVRTISFPDKVRLADGSTYTVSGINVNGFTNNVAAFAESAGTVTDLVIGKNISSINGYATRDFAGHLGTVTVKSRKLTEKLVQTNSFYACPQIDRVVVSVSDQHAVNAKILKSIRQIFAHDRIEATVAKWGCSTKAKSIKGAAVTLARKRYAYDSGKKTPSASVRVNGKKLKKGRDYMVCYKNNVKAGTAKAIIKGIGNYAGSVSRTFKISKTPIKKASIKIMRTKSRTQASKLRTTVKIGGYQLKKGRDFTIEYKKAGSGRRYAVIKGINSMNGVMTVSYKN